MTHHALVHPANTRTHTFTRTHHTHKPPPRLQDAVRGEFREVAKLLSDNGGQVWEESGLIDLKDSKLAGVFGYVPQKMFDFDPEW